MADAAYRTAMAPETTTLTPEPQRPRGLASVEDDTLWDALPRAFFERDAETVARDLIGRFLVHDTPDGRTVGRIVETEAYLGTDDRAAHVFGDRRTRRTEVFWASGGHAYVFLIYGMYDCFNVVTGPAGDPSAVLVRALEPVAGIELMARRRGVVLEAPSPRGRLRARIGLTSGPGRLCQAMGIHRADHYGVDLTIAPLHITGGKPADARTITAGPRVNIDYAGADAALPLRFSLQGSPFVTKG